MRNDRQHGISPTCRLIVSINVILLGMLRSAEASPPLLIQHQPEAIQQAWKEIEQVLQENEKLDAPLAEPYLARGDLWSRIGGHEDALSDYLKATELFLKGNPTPGEQARHLVRLRSSLEAVVNQPRPHFPGDAATEFDKGVAAFRIGDAATAGLCFVECTRLMPDTPIYRVYRALAHRQLDQTDEAKRQIAIALSLIRSADVADQMTQINRGLEPVQGRLRLWLAAELEMAVRGFAKIGRFNGHLHVPIQFLPDRIRESACDVGRFFACADFMVGGEREG